MRRHRSILVFTLTIALALAASLGMGHFAASSIINAQQDRQLNDLALLALRRAEAVVDDGSDALQLLIDDDAIDCSPLALQKVRFAIYESGQIKDIRIGAADASVRCSAFPETLEFDKTWPRFEDMLTTASTNSYLFLVEQFSDTALGILKQITSDTTLIGVISVNTAILDVMPAQLHEQSTIAVALADETEIARYTPTAFDNGINAKQISTSSPRYPLKSIITVSDDALAGWNTEAYLPIMALAAALGLAVGLLISRVLVQPASPVAELDKAIAADEIKPFYQPVFDLDSGAITGCEMLARWIKPSGDIVSPARFIPLAESSGRIDAITWQLLRTALTELGQTLRANRTFTVSINVTPDHFMSPHFTDDLSAIISDTRIENRQICIEITEREPFADLAAAAANVARIRKDGFQVAIDDVGIGHSGLSHLQALQADTLKIDKFFVDTVEQDDTARSIIQMLTRLAQRLDMQLIAEGIEHRGQIDALLDCGVMRGQGYLVSPPIPASAFLEMYDKRKGRTGFAEVA